MSGAKPARMIDDEQSVLTSTTKVSSTVKPEASRVQKQSSEGSRSLMFSDVKQGSIEAVDNFR